MGANSQISALKHQGELQSREFSALKESHLEALRIVQSKLEQTTKDAAVAFNEVHLKEIELVSSVEVVAEMKTKQQGFESEKTELEGLLQSATNKSAEIKIQLDAKNKSLHDAHASIKQLGLRNAKMEARCEELGVAAQRKQDQLLLLKTTQTQMLDQKTAEMQAMRESHAHALQEIRTQLVTAAEENQGLQTSHAVVVGALRSQLEEVSANAESTTVLLAGKEVELAQTAKSNKSLEMRVQRLKQAQALVMSQLEVSSADKLELQDRLGQEEADLERTRQMLDSLRQECLQVRLQRTEMEAAVEGREASLREAQVLCERQLEAKASVLEKMRTEHQESLEVLHHQLGMANTAADLSSKNFSSKDQELNKCTQILALTQSDLQRVEGERDSMQAQLEEAVGQRLAFETQLREKEFSLVSATQQLSAAQEQHTMLNRSVKELESKLCSKEGALARLEQTHGTQLAKKEDEISALRGCQAEVRQEFERKAEQANELHSVSVQSQQKKDRLLQKGKEVEHELHTKIERLAFERLAAEKQLEAVSREKQHMRSQYDSVSAELQGSRKEVIELREQCIHLQSSASMLDTSQQVKAEELEELELGLARQLAAKDTEMRSLQAEHGKTLDALHQQLASALGDAQSSSDLLRGKQHELTKSAQAVEELQLQVDRLEEEKAAIVQVCATLGQTTEVGQSPSEQTVEADPFPLGQTTEVGQSSLGQTAEAADPFSLGQTAEVGQSSLGQTVEVDPSFLGQQQQHEAQCLLEALQEEHATLRDEAARLQISLQEKDSASQQLQGEVGAIVTAMKDQQVRYSNTLSVKDAALLKHTETAAIMEAELAHEVAARQAMQSQVGVMTAENERLDALLASKQQQVAATSPIDMANLRASLDTASLDRHRLNQQLDELRASYSNATSRITSLESRHQQDAETVHGALKAEGDVRRNLQQQLRSNEILQKELALLKQQLQNGSAFGENMMEASETAVSYMEDRITRLVMDQKALVSERDALAQKLADFEAMAADIENIGAFMQDSTGGEQEMAIAELGSELADTKAKLKQFQALYNLQNVQSPSQLSQSKVNGSHSRLQSPSQAAEETNNMSPSASMERYTFTSAQQPDLFSLDGVLQHTREDTSPSRLN